MSASPIAVQLLQLALRGAANAGDRVDAHLRQVFTNFGIPVPEHTEGEVWTRAVRKLADTLEGQGGLDRFIAALKEGHAHNGLGGVERLVHKLKKKK